MIRGPDCPAHLLMKTEYKVAVSQSRDSIFQEREGKTQKDDLRLSRYVGCNSDIREEKKKKVRSDFPVKGSG